MSTPQSTSGTLTPATTEAKAFLTVPGQGQYNQSPLRVKNVPGYSTPVFKGKEEQRAKVQANVAAKVRSFPRPLCPPCALRAITLRRFYIVERGGRVLRAVPTAFAVRYDRD